MGSAKSNRVSSGASLANCVPPPCGGGKQLQPPGRQGVNPCWFVAVVAGGYNTRFIGLIRREKNPLMGSLFSTNQWFWQERILRIAHQSSLKEAELYLFVDTVYWIIIYELVMNYIYIYIYELWFIMMYHYVHYGTMDIINYMILLSQAAGFAMEDPLDSKSNDLVDMGPELSCVVSAYRLALNQIMSWAR